THDHKRGEDVRARLATLSELAQVWTDKVARWIEASTQLKSNGRPAAADIAMLLQMIVGGWPLDLKLDDAAAAPRSQSVWPYGRKRRCVKPNFAAIGQIRTKPTKSLREPF